MAHQPWTWSTETQALIEGELDDRRTVGRQRRSQCWLELGVPVDPDAARPARPGDRGEIDRTELGARRPRLSLAAPATSGSCRSARCRRRRPRRVRRSRTAVSSSARVIAETAVADEGDHGPVAMHQGGGDGRGQAVAHRAGRRTRGTCPGGGSGSRVPPSRRSCRRRWSGSRRRAARAAGSRPSGPDGRRARPTGGHRPRSRPPRRPDRRRCWPGARPPGSASRTARPTRRSLAARRNALASLVTVISAGPAVRLARRDRGRRGPSAGPRAERRSRSS